MLIQLDTQALSAERFVQNESIDLFEVEKLCA